MNRSGGRTFRASCPSGRGQAAGCVLAAGESAPCCTNPRLRGGVAAGGLGGQGFAEDGVFGLGADGLGEGFGGVAQGGDTVLRLGGVSDNFVLDIR